MSINLPEYYKKYGVTKMTLALPNLGGPSLFNVVVPEDGLSAISDIPDFAKSFAIQFHYCH
jgi:hypothetical protein